MNAKPNGKSTASGRLIARQQGYSVSHKAVGNGATPEGAVGPLNPRNVQKPKRTRLLKIRLTEDEFLQLSRRASKRGLSRLVRQALYSTRGPVTQPMNCELLRLLGRFCNTLNVVARLARQISNPECQVQVLAHLVSLDREVKKLVHQL